MSSKINNDIEFNFPDINVMSIDTTQYKSIYFVSAFFESDSTNLYIHSNKTYYTTEKFYIIGALDKDSDYTLIISLKPMKKTQDQDPDIENTSSKTSNVFMYFPLKNSYETTVLDDKINIIKKIIVNDQKKAVNNMNLNEIIDETQLKNMSFSFKIDRNDPLIDVYIYKFNYIFDVYKLLKILPLDEYNWITVDVQKNSALSNLPFDLSMLSIDNSKKKVADAKMNLKLNNPDVSTFTTRESFKEGAKGSIVMKCGPVSKSERTTPMALVPSGSSSSSQYQVFIFMFFVAMATMLSVVLGQKMIYQSLSDDFKMIIGIDKTLENTTEKNKMGAIQMYGKFLIDTIPFASHFLDKKREYGYFLGSSSTIKNTQEFAKRFLFWFVWIGLIVGMSTTKKTTKTIFIILFISLVFSQFLFFSLMMTTDPNTLKY